MSADGSEGKRALVATALGLAFGAFVALFSRRDRRPDPRPDKTE